MPTSIRLLDAKALILRDQGYTEHNDDVLSQAIAVYDRILEIQPDAGHAHFYGLSHDDFAYILTTFPVLEKNERRKYGEYRTARLALAAYDALVG